VEEAMDFQTLEDWKNANPFQPFRIVMTDGRMFEIKHPNLLWPGRSTVLVGIQDQGEQPGVFNHYVSVAMLHVVRIEPLTHSASVNP
jgi:hypothetical protein